MGAVGVKEKAQGIARNDRNMRVANHTMEDARHRLMARLMIITPFLGFVGAVILLWGTGSTLTSLILCGVMYLISALGLTMGYHRLFTHKSFEAKRPLKSGSAIAGAMAAEGPVFWWCATYRRHHQSSDSSLDPHSPHQPGDDVRGLPRGFLHAHVGWMFVGPISKLRASNKAAAVLAQLGGEIINCGDRLMRFEDPFYRGPMQLMRMHSEVYDPAIAMTVESCRLLISNGGILIK